MAIRISWEGVPCPIGRAVDVLGDPWTLLILRQAMTGCTRYDEFRNTIGISDNILSVRLKRLLAAGLLIQVPYRADGGRTRQEYRLTEAGANTLPVLHALAEWGHAHTRTDDPNGTMQVIHQTCGKPAGSGTRCAHCRKVLKRESLAWLRPWKSAEPTPLAPAVTAG
ncbi:helix-turn-helix transcriptional regulator [Saccharopolyspora sp. K220]|uniref:winged helix-turn-helix transcriptional regulator n=1 Tax=Saccharopolyspora soli TaxID=2926618 RepID=UPI001F5AE9A9|nr:helix-turn-helix domain-containing protein [Saccharopolyspora soli]MCI2417452.1 helix-turn-helix transcriptional regulator [Saccharopolyspora soli]